MTQPLPRSLRFALLFPLLLVTSLSLALAKTDATPKPLTWTPVLGDTAEEIVDKLESRHYQKQALDDALSAQLLDAYLKTLDASRMFLLQSDVDGFARYRTTLDDTLHKGDIEPGFVIFRRFQDRVTQRLEKILSSLPATIAAMDFTKTESIDLGRDKNPTWPKTQAEADELWRLHLKIRY